MNYKVELLPRARKELLDAWDWYDDRWTGLGDRFLREVEKTLEQIEKNHCCKFHFSHQQEPPKKVRGR